MDLEPALSSKHFHRAMVAQAGDSTEIMEFPEPGEGNRLQTY